MREKSILATLIFLILLPIFSQSTHEDRTLNIGIESDIDIRGPWESRYAVNGKIFCNVLETLVAFEEKTSKIKPHLATSWKTSSNNRVWIFKLREGVKFHDGSMLKSDDVISSSNIFSDFNGKAEKVDHRTVRFILTEPNSAFLNELTRYRRAIASSKNIEEYKFLQKKGRLDDFIPVGTGPFRFIQHAKGKQINLESFPDYWQGNPWLKKLVYKIILDNKDRLSALENGDIDLLDVLYPADLPQIKENPNLNILSLYGMNICFIALNTTHKPLNNIKIRQALNLSVNKMRLAQMFYYGGYGVPTNRLLSPAFWGFSALPSPGNFKPEVAKRMLDEAGYSRETTLKMVCIPHARPYLPNPQSMAEEIKKQFNNIGVKVIIVMPENFNEFYSIIRNRNYDLALSGWINLTGDPDYTLSYLLSSKFINIYNYSLWQNKLLDKKLQAARKLHPNDIAGKIRLYNEVQKIVQNEVPYIPLSHTKIFVIHHRKVKGLILYPTSMISYNKVRFVH